MTTRTLGLPLHCPKCPPRRYYGVLKGEYIRTPLVRFGPRDTCPNCKTQLVAGKEP